MAQAAGLEGAAAQMCRQALHTYSRPRLHALGVLRAAQCAMCLLAVQSPACRNPLAPMLTAASLRLQQLAAGLIPASIQRCSRSSAVLWQLACCGQPCVQSAALPLQACAAAACTVHVNGCRHVVGCMQSVVHLLCTAAACIGCWLAMAVPAGQAAAYIPQCGLSVNQHKAACATCFDRTCFCC